MFEISLNETNQVEPKIMIIGVGGGGNNAVDRMIESDVSRVEFAAINTDADVLNNCKANHKIQIGKKLLKGYGAGSDPMLGEAAANESEEEIKELIEGYEMVIITGGMGGGTGTGAAPVVAKICKDSGILTLGVVTMPFSFENGPRMITAKSGVEKMRGNVDTLLIIPNDKLLGLSDKPLILEDAFEMADSVLKYSIEGITNIVYNRGIINTDFNDLRTILSGKGIGHFGVGIVPEDGSILDAVKQAINSPLLDTTIMGASNLLINTSGRVNVTALEEAINFVKEQAGQKVDVIWGTVGDANYNEGKIVVTLIATGMREDEALVGQKETTIVTLNQNKKEVDIDIPPFLRKYVNRK